MKRLALQIALFVIAVGVVGVIRPDALVAAGQYVLTPRGLLGIAGLRVAFGIVLLLVAPSTRAPKVVRVLGAVALVAGLMTPIFGVERSRAVMAWETSYGNAPIRAGAALAVALGGFLAFAVAAGRRPA